MLPSNEKLTQEEINKIINGTSPFGLSVVFKPISISWKDELQKIKDRMMKELMKD